MSRVDSHAFADAASLIGINLESHPDHSWLVDSALEYRLDSEEWKELVSEAGEVTYYNVKSGVRLSTRNLLFLRG